MTAALDHPTLAIDARPRAVAAVVRVAGGLRSFLRAIVNRREVNRLCHLSDHELADIGLTRTDLVVVMRGPIGVDPTVQLSQFAYERHSISIEDAARRVG